MVSSTSNIPPHRSCQICSGQIIDGVCSICGACAEQVANAIDAQTQSLSKDFEKLTPQDLRHFMDQTSDHSETLWHLTSTAFKSTAIKAETQQQISSLLLQTLIMVPTGLSVALIAFLIAHAISAGSGFGTIQHSLISVSTLVILGFPLMMLVERLVPATNIQTAVPLAILPAANRRVKVPIAFNSNFQFPLVLGTAWLLSRLLWHAI